MDVTTTITPIINHESNYPQKPFFNNRGFFLWRRFARPRTAYIVRFYALVVAKMRSATHRVPAAQPFITELSLADFQRGSKLI